MSQFNRIGTVPNVLSFFRLLLLVPIMVSLVHGQRLWALLWMLIGLATDWLDGIIARRWDQRSDLGRILDPVIDKVDVLVVCFYLVISPRYFFPLWYFLFLLIRELILTMCSLLVIRKKRMVMESNRQGKNSAFANGVVVIFFVLGLEPYSHMILWVAFALTLYSSWVYLRLFLRQMQPKNSQGSR